MTWRERRRPASWRGIPFEVESISGTFGRHNVEHTFPLRDEVYVEELSIMPRHHAIRGYVIGDDYDRAMLQLRAAAELGGEGTFVHPTLGRLICKVGAPMTVEEPMDAQGRATFELDLVESSPRLYPEIRVEPAAQLDDRASDVRASTSARYEEDYNVSGPVGTTALGWVRQRAEQYQADMVTRYETALATVRNELSDDDQQAAAQAIATFEELVDATSGATVADGAIALLGTIPAFTLFSTFFALVEDTPPDVAIASTSWDADSQNNQGTFRMWRRAAEALLIDAMIEGDIVFADATEAAEFESEFVDIFDGELNEADVQLDGTLFLDIYNLKLAGLAWLESETATLATVRTYTPPKTTPALVIAHRLYGDADRSDEIVDRNAIAHPLFVPGGKPLLVLSA